MAKPRVRIVAKGSDLDSRTFEFWVTLSRNPMFHKIIEHCESHRGEFSPDKSPSQFAHVQSERNGGVKAWDKLTDILLNPPKPELEQEEE
jgi:hypothetical protein